MKSQLATKEILSPNYSQRKSPVKKFTIHHAGVVAPAENVAKNFQNPAREASSNYVIGGDGSIIMCVPEEFRAWTSSNEGNDTQAITVEICNSTGAPEWKVSDAALEAVINLGVDICQRYGLPGFTWTGDKNGTLTIHKMFIATVCPGPYLESKMPYIAQEITRRIKEDNPMIYKINLEDLKKQGYTSIAFDFGAVTAPVSAPAQPAVQTPTIKAGSTVRVKNGAKTYDGKGLASFIYNRDHIVKEVKGDRAVITYGGTVVAAIKVSDLILV